MPGPYQSPVAKSVPFDNTTNGFTAQDVQAAIEESKQTAMDAGGNMLFAFDGSASTGRWLENATNVSSNSCPQIVAGSKVLRALSASCESNATATITIFKNGSAFTTISFAASKKNVVLNINLALANLDEVKAQVTSGSCSRPVMLLWF